MHQLRTNKSSNLNEHVLNITKKVRKNEKT